MRSLQRCIYPATIHRRGGNLPPALQPMRRVIQILFSNIRPLLFSSPCGQGEFGPVRSCGGTGQHGIRCDRRKHPPTGSAAQRRMLSLPALLQMVASQVHIPGQTKPVRIQNAQGIVRRRQRRAPALQPSDNIKSRCRGQSIRPHWRHIGANDRISGSCLPHFPLGNQPGQPGKIAFGHAVPDPLAQGGQAAACFHLTLHGFTNLFATA